MDLFAKRGTFMMPQIDEKAALDQALAITNGPVVIADMWDNPGGGTAGDATVILEEMLARGVTNAAVGMIWDPIAVQICMAAGEGAEIRCALARNRPRHRASGRWTGQGGEGRAQRRDALRRQHRPVWRCRPHSSRRYRHRLSSVRVQSYDPSLFTALGIDPTQKHLLVIKSTNHFYAAFSKIASEIIYCAAGTPYPNNPAKTAYRHVRRDIWPIMANPHDAPQGSEAA